MSARGSPAALTASLDSPFLGAAAQIPRSPPLQAAYWRLVRGALP